MSPKLYIPLIVLAVVAVGLGVYDYRYIINPPKNAGVQPIVAMPQFEAVSTSSPVVVTHTRAKGMDIYSGVTPGATNCAQVSVRPQTIFSKPPQLNLFLTIERQATSSQQCVANSGSTPQPFYISVGNTSTSSESIKIGTVFVNGQSVAFKVVEGK